MNGALSEDLVTAPCKLYLGEWIVEKILPDGQVAMTRFSGPDAAFRAKAYAAAIDDGRLP